MLAGGALTMVSQNPKSDPMARAHGARTLQFTPSEFVPDRGAQIMVTLDKSCYVMEMLYVPSLRRL